MRMWRVFRHLFDQKPLKQLQSRIGSEDARLGHAMIFLDGDPMTLREEQVKLGLRCLDVSRHDVVSCLHFGLTERAFNCLTTFAQRAQRVGCS